MSTVEPTRGPSPARLREIRRVALLDEADRHLDAARHEISRGGYDRNTPIGLPPRDHSPKAAAHATFALALIARAEELLP